MLVKDNEEILLAENFREILDNDALHASLGHESQETALEMSVVQFVMQDIRFFHLAFDFSKNAFLSTALDL